MPRESERTCTAANGRIKFVLVAFSPGTVVAGKLDVRHRETDSQRQIMFVLLFHLAK